MRDAVAAQLVPRIDERMHRRRIAVRDFAREK